MNSYKVNSQNNIELTIVPIVKNSSEIVVYLPTYLTSQIQNIQSTNTNISSSLKLMQGSTQQQINLQFNATMNLYLFTLPLNQSALTQNLSLQLNNLQNPVSNQPFYFII